MENLNDISVATYDEENRCLILIGKENLSLPKMNIDYLVVAIRSIYAGEDPGVSIDPVAPGKTDLKHPESIDKRMKATYYGKTEKNNFGSILYECDRYLKSMVAGKNNITEKPVKTNVDGYFSEVKLSLKYGPSIASQKF